MLHPEKSPPGKFKNELFCKVHLLKAPDGTCHNGTAATFKNKVAHPCHERKKITKCLYAQCCN